MSASPHPPTLADEFSRLREQTEALWSSKELDRGIYGFQFQRGTRWNPGLSAGEIDAYERELGVRFPAILCVMLSMMNGTDLPTINIYGSSGINPKESVGVLSFPRDLEHARELMAIVEEDRAEVADVLGEQGFSLEPADALVPIYIHRYLVCRPNAPDGPVLSICGTDAIVCMGRTCSPTCGSSS